MSNYNALGNAAGYAKDHAGHSKIWLEVVEAGIRVRGIAPGAVGEEGVQGADREVAWINLEGYRNGPEAILTKTIDEVSAMLANRPESAMESAR